MREILESPEAVAIRGAEIFIETVLGSQGSFSVLLSGGKTPEILYRELVRFKGKIPWERICFFFGDERIVPQTNTESNFRLAYETLLKHVPIPKENIFPVPTELKDPQKIAVVYGQTIQKHFGDQTPAFDFVFLGMGADGHTASLFPDSNYVEESKAHELVIAPYVESQKKNRISVTLKVLNHSKKIVFLVTGTSKAPVLKVLAPPLPAAMVAPPRGQVIWLLDRAAVQ